MNIRSDSPFFGIGEQELGDLLMEAEFRTVEELAEVWTRAYNRDVNETQMKRFLRRARMEREMREMEDDAGMADRLSARLKDGKARDGVIEVARQKLLEEAVEKGDQKLMLELYRATNEERARAQEVEVKQRCAAVAEEKARIGWRKLELEQAKSVMRLLPAIRAALMEGAARVGERGANVGELLLAVGGRLLGEGNGT